MCFEIEEEIMEKTMMRVTVVECGAVFYEGSEIWVDQKRVFDYNESELADERDVKIVANAVCETLNALGMYCQIQWCNWNDTSELASPFRVADGASGDYIKEDIAAFDEAVAIADRLAKSGDKEDVKILGGYEVLNRFGNSVYKIEEDV
jgi:hypothetical protein